MTKDNLPTFTFIANFRGGIYCSQVQAENMNKSVVAWTEKLKLEKKGIKFLGDKIIKEIQLDSMDEDNQPTPLSGLKNIWHTLYTTSKGTFFVNIIQTQITY